MQGTLAQVDGRWELTFVRRLAHSPEKVWRTLTEPEHLAVWFPTAIEGDRAPGAPLRFVFRDGEGPPSDGEMLAYEPPWRLEYRWGDEILRFRVEPDGPGCVLTLVDVFDQLGKAARDAAGWHTCLDVLGHHLDGDLPPWPASARWADVHPGYVERFGPEAATIGPPASG
ncbi:MAG TPA: SRPBCC family protein [Acidimicrobiales bacterium]|jgi:uncharacterized protein YndB with AHSA1/START domain|nr:SRPBCC family protein [Acidimicrobiales bacterium]